MRVIQYLILKIKKNWNQPKKINKERNHFGQKNRNIKLEKRLITASPPPFKFYKKQSYELIKPMQPSLKGEMM